MRHPVLTTLVGIIVIEAPFVAFIALVGAPWWYLVAAAVLPALLGGYVAARVYRNPSDPGAVVRFFQDSAGWFSGF